MGFERSKVIDVMRKLNYRGSNIARVGEDAIVTELIRGA